MRRLVGSMTFAVAVLAAPTATTKAAADNPYADDRIVAYGWVGRVDVHGWDCPVPVDRVTSITVGEGDQLLICIGLVNFSDEWMNFGILRDGDIGIWDWRHVPLQPNSMSTFGFSYTANDARTFDYYWHPVDASGDMLATFAQVNVEIGPERDPPDPTDPPVGPVVPGLDLVAERALTVDLTAQVDDGSDDCATGQAVAVDAGTDVAYCYRLTNTGNDTLNLHDVVDSVHGQVMGPDIDDPLAPGESLFYLGRAPVDTSAVHVLSWTATTESGSVLHGEDALSVIALQPGIELDLTVGPDEGAGVCGDSDDLVIEPGAAVRFCYTMTNVGDEAVDVHSLFDDQLGWIFEDDVATVAPGESLVREAVAEPTDSARTIASWVAERQESGIETAASDSAHVIIATPCPATEAAQAPLPPTAPPIAQQPAPAPSTLAPTTTTSTVPPTTTTTTTTTTLPPSTTQPVLVNPTTTTLPVIVILTTTTIGSGPAGFARGLGEAPQFAPTPCPESEGTVPESSEPGTDPGGGDPGGGDPGGGDPGGGDPGGGDPGGDTGGGDPDGDPTGDPGGGSIAGTLPATGGGHAGLVVVAVTFGSAGAIVIVATTRRRRHGT